LLVASEAANAQDSAESIFEGQTIEIIVPTGVGGGTDTTARFLSVLIAQHLPGNPDTQVFNIDMSRHVPGMNEWATQRDADGLHWLMSSGSGHLPMIFGDPYVHYDLSEHSPVLATTVGNVILGRSEKLKSLDDLRAASELYYGGGGPVGSDTVQLLGFRILGLKTSPVFGMDEGPQRIAFEQGEIDLVYNTTPAYLGGGVDLVDRGMATVLYTAGQLKDGDVVRDPAFPDVPTVKEVYEAWNGSAPSGPEWEAYKSLLATTTSFSKVLWLHGEAPDAALSAVEDAVAEMVASEGFYGEAEKVIGPYELAIGDQAATDIKTAFGIDPEVLDWLKGWLSSEFEVKLPE
jgi:hypothetical protein